MTAPTTPLAAVVEALREARLLYPDYNVTVAARELLAKLAETNDEVYQRGYAEGWKHARTGRIDPDPTPTAPGPAGAEAISDDTIRNIASAYSVIPTSNVRQFVRECVAAARVTHPARADLEGWVMVPKDPTHQMCPSQGLRAAWAWALAAAPSPPRPAR